MSSLIDEIKLKIIMICHLILVLFVVITPLTNSNYLLLMHSIIVPFIMIHWLANNDMCVLTLAEKEIRKRLNKYSVSDECFTCKIIEPVFNFKSNNNENATYIYIATTLLWTTSLIKLYNKYKTKNIQSFYDLLII